MENFGAVQWPDLNGAARQAKLKLLMLNQTTGKARDFVFESIADNVLWAEACEALKERFEGEQVRHDASEKIAKGLMFREEAIQDFQSRWNRMVKQVDLQFSESQKLLFLELRSDLSSVKM